MELTFFLCCLFFDSLFHSYPENKPGTLQKKMKLNMTSPDDFLMHRIYIWVCLTDCHISVVFLFDNRILLSTVAITINSCYWLRKRQKNKHEFNVRKPLVAICKLLRVARFTAIFDVNSFVIVGLVTGCHLFLKSMSIRIVFIFTVVSVNEV